MLIAATCGQRKATSTASVMTGTAYGSRRSPGRRERDASGKRIADAPTILTQINTRSPSPCTISQNELGGKADDIRLRQGRSGGAANHRRRYCGSAGAGLARFSGHAVLWPAVR